ncbi:MAG: AMP-binding protein [Cellvibrionales bacterium]|nr:AMP-binding protein [Cellvibrionales bacterium]
MPKSDIDHAIAAARDRLNIGQTLPKEGLETFAALFHHARTHFADRPAYRCLGHHLSFAELDRHSDHLAAYLQSLDFLQPGDRIALQLPNLLQWPVAAMAILKVGLILVNTNPLYTAPELAHQLKDSGAKLVITLTSLAGPLQQIIAQTAVQQVILTAPADLHPPPKRPLINALFTLKTRPPRLHFPNAIRYRQALTQGAKQGAKHPLKPPPTTPDATALLQYTGGTTGRSKGVILTHRALMACMQQTAWVYAKVDWTASHPRMAVPLPLYHIYAFSVAFTHALYCGHESLLIPNPRDIKVFIRQLRQQPCTGLIGLNTLFNALMQHPDFPRLDFSRTKLTISGGMALSKSIAERWQAITGTQICEGYGLTECAGIMSVNDPQSPTLGTVGCIFPATAVKIKDPDGHELGIDDPGELYFTGPTKMTGFWQQPNALDDLLDKDGYMRTGDIATVGKDGLLRIIDRTKDMIIVSGFNVYPNEVEDVALAHPAVQECAAIAGQDENGEYLRLFVVPGPTPPSEAELRAHCRQHLTGYKVPRTVTFIEEMPKTPVGKPLRRTLRETYPA